MSRATPPPPRARRPFRLLLLAVLLALAPACEEVTVSVVDVASVTVDPGAVTLVPEASTQLSATPRDAAGRALPGRDVTWSSENPGVAGVSPSGTVQGVVPGTAIIVATSDGVSGSAQVTVQPGPRIVLSRQTVGFTGPQGGGTLAPEAVQVTNGGGGTLAGLSTAVEFGAGGPGGWLEATLQGTSAPTSLAIRATPGTLAAGSYQARVRLTAQGASVAPGLVEVTLTVQPVAPLLQVSPEAVGFSSSEGEGPPASQTVTVSNGGGGIIRSLSTSIAYAAGQPGGWLTAELDARTAPTALRLQVDPAGLAAGIFDAQVRVSSPDTPGGDATVQVRFRFGEPPPRLAFVPTRVLVIQEEDAPPPSPVQVRVENTGGGQVGAMTVRTEFAPGTPQGWVTTTLAGSSAPSTVSLVFQPVVLPLGSHVARVVVDSPDAVNTPVELDVERQVIPRPSVATSRIEAEPDSLPADGVSTSQITVTLLDPRGAPVDRGGDDVEILSSAGTIGSTADLGEGRYRAVLTASTTEEAAVVSALLRGQPLADTARVVFGPTPEPDPDPEPDAGASGLAVAPDTLAVGDTAVVTVQLRDADGVALTTSGDAVFLATSLGSVDPAGGLSTEGLFTAVFVSDSAGTAEITAFLGSDASGDLIGTATVTVEAEAGAGDPDPESSELTMELEGDTFATDGTLTIRIQLRDSDETPLTRSGDVVFLTTTLGTLDPPRGETTEGAFTSVFTATEAGTADIAAFLEVNGQEREIGQLTLTVVEGAPDAEASQLTVGSARLGPNVSTSVRVELRDSAGNRLTTSGVPIFLTTTRGQVTPASGTTVNGVFGATFSSAQLGSADISAFLGTDATAPRIGLVTVVVQSSGEDGMTSEGVGSEGAPDLPAGSRESTR
jgi:hypothetical protein